MSDPIHKKQPTESSRTSPLSLLLDAADSQTSEKGKEGKMKSATAPPNPNTNTKLQTPAQPKEIQSQQQRQLQAILPLVPHPAGINGATLLQQQAAFAAAAQQQVAALALATDIRAAVAAAQLQQAANIQNHDLLIARAAALNQQQLGLAGLAGGLSKEQLEELQRQQHLIAMAAPGQLTSSALAARQQIQDAQMPPGQTNQDTILNRAGLHRAPMGVPSSSSIAGSTSTGLMSIQKPPGSVVVPCRARGMPMDHNFKVCYLCALAYSAF